MLISSEATGPNLIYSRAVRSPCRFHHGYGTIRHDSIRENLLSHVSQQRTMVTVEHAGNPPSEMIGLTAPSRSLRSPAYRIPECHMHGEEARVPAETDGTSPGVMSRSRQGDSKIANGSHLITMSNRDSGGPMYGVNRHYPLN